jgi:hypothetical protein
VVQETHEIHTSEIRSFHSCRRRWDLAYRQGYLPEETPKPLEFGIAFHIAMQVFYNPETWSSTTPKEKVEAAVTAFIGECERQRRVYLQFTNQERLMEGEGDDYTARIDLGIGMLEWYGLQIHPEWDTWFKPVYVEVPFRVPIHHPDGSILTCPYEHGECGQLHPKDAPVTYDGRLDLIIEDLLNGGYFIWDHKSAAQPRKNDMLLNIDPQVGGYTWAARVMLGIDVRGFMYVEFRKGFPKPPDLLTRRYKGKLFSTNKLAETDLDHFLATVKRNDSVALEQGLYDEYIQWLKGGDRNHPPPVYHQRFPVVKTRKELRLFGDYIYQVATDMVDPRLRIYPSPSQYSCSGCPYFQPCLHMFMGEDHMHSLQTNFRKVK